MADITEQSGLGAATTPEEWAAFVLEHLAHESVTLASGATRIDTSAKQIHVPRVTDDGGVNWYSELEEIKNDAPDGDDLVLTPKKVAALVRLSNESVGDSSPKVLDSTGAAMMRAVALAADRAIWHGIGGKQPLGILEGEALPTDTLDVTYEGLVTAAGWIPGAGMAACRELPKSLPERVRMDVFGAGLPQGGSASSSTLVACTKRNPARTRTSIRRPLGSARTPLTAVSDGTALRYGAGWRQGDARSGVAVKQLASACVAAPVADSATGRPIVDRVGGEGPASRPPAGPETSAPRRSPMPGRAVFPGLGGRR